MKRKEKKKVLNARRSVKAKFSNKMETWIVGIAYPTFLLTEYPWLSNHCKTELGLQSTKGEP